jgi:hypothetical protein
VFAEQITEYLREARERRVVPTLVETPASAPPAASDESHPDMLPAPRSLLKKETITELLARLFPAGGQDDEHSSPEVPRVLVAESDAEPPVESSSQVFPVAEADVDAPYEHQPTSFAGPMAIPQEDVFPPASLATSVRQIVTMPVSGGARSGVNMAVAVSVDVGADVSTVKRGRTTQPVQNEWGFFDPNQCGFPALVAKLDEIAARDSDS